MMGWCSDINIVKDLYYCCKCFRPARDGAARVNRQLRKSLHESGWTGFGNSFGRQEGLNLNGERLAEENGI